MKLSVPLLLTGSLGALFLWCGITDRNPIAVLRAVMTGGTIPVKGSGKSGATAPLLPNTAPGGPGSGPGPQIPGEPPLPGTF